jgi:hypothetical protein
MEASRFRSAPPLLLKPYGLRVATKWEIFVDRRDTLRVAKLP